ncbi:unnamed protein product [Prorocentrum cordatum]|uniref:Uncharacterized protein n=1 Tax=Prorocentrum cordatum TaxID=2364126 RepID=A0ABN9SD65_9DINO|nr:unnamed protein product [Polarella glacialis]
MIETFANFNFCWLATQSGRACLLRSCGHGRWLPRTSDGWPQSSRLLGRDSLLDADRCMVIMPASPLQLFAVVALSSTRFLAMRAFHLEAVGSILWFVLGEFRKYSVASNVRQGARFLWLLRV